MILLFSFSFLSPGTYYRLSAFCPIEMYMLERCPFENDAHLRESSVLRGVHLKELPT